MDERGQGFSFVDAGRTFTCRVEHSRSRAGDAWWWFDVSTERHERHAPFRADVTDTQAGVRARVVAYYDDWLARRAAPAQPRWQKRPRVAVDAAATAQVQESPAPEA
jgi:hypothetical protein